MLTSTDHCSSTTRCREFGIATYLIKPIRTTELFTAIRKVFGYVEMEQTPGTIVYTVAPSGEPLRILVAEDNTVNQKLAAAMLEKMGHRVTLAVNGEEVVAKWVESEFDLILMDVQMPGMDGFEATSQIRAHEAAKGTHTPIIAMTANAMAGDRERCVAAGMDDYVSKPISRRSLDEAIRRLTFHPI